MTPLAIIIICFLFVVSIIDYRIRAIPSVILTGLLFVVVLLNPANLVYGIATFILSYLLYESTFFDGVADIKIMTALGFMISTINNLALYLILICVFGITWKIVYKWRVANVKETPFIPVFLFVYLALLILGVIV